MKFDIIETDCLRNWKSFSTYFRIIAGISAILLVLDLINYGVAVENRIIKITSTSFIFIFFSIEILNAILFSRIGTINFGSENIVIDREKKYSEFLLSDIQNVQISKIQSNHYLIDVKPNYQEIIELKGNDLAKLKSYFEINQIDCEIKSTNNWIKKTFERK